MRSRRYTFRLLRRMPLFTAVVLATLAMGTGASTAIFSVIDAVLLRPLSFAEPQRLMMGSDDVRHALSR